MTREQMIETIAANIWAATGLPRDDARDLAAAIVLESETVEAPPTEVAEYIIGILNGEINAILSRTV